MRFMQKMYRAFIIPLLLAFVSTPAILSSTALADSGVDAAQMTIAQPQIQLPSTLPSSYYAASSSAPAIAVVTPPAVHAVEISAPAPARATLSGPLRPVHLFIPSVGINASIQAVGTTKNGEMDVPSGKSNNVGWYKYGTIPGKTGSAVIDAHVFAAFAALKRVKPGDSIYVAMSDGSQRHFVVSAAKNFPTVGLSPLQLFRPTSTADLNLITCAGSLTPDHSTYDHRLIVYSTLVRN